MEEPILYNSVIKYVFEMFKAVDAWFDQDALSVLCMKHFFYFYGFKKLKYIYEMSFMSSKCLTLKIEEYFNWHTCLSQFEFKNTPVTILFKISPLVLF